MLFKTSAKKWDYWNGMGNGYEKFYAICFSKYFILYQTKYFRKRGFLTLSSRIFVLPTFPYT